MSNHAAIESDLRAVFARFPVNCLRHLQANRHRLIRRSYCGPGGRGCLMSLLSEPLPPESRIDSKKALTRFFGDGDPESEEYQPARWLVRLWDRQVCSQVRARYGERPELGEDLLFTVLEQTIAERTATAAIPSDRTRTVDKDDIRPPSRYAVGC